LRPVAIDWGADAELGFFVHATEGEMVCKSTHEKIPYFNAPIYLQNKEQIGKVEEVLGPIKEVVIILLIAINWRQLIGVFYLHSTLPSRWARALSPTRSRPTTRSSSARTSCSPSPSSCPSPRRPRRPAVPQGNAVALAAAVVEALAAAVVEALAAAVVEAVAVAASAEVVVAAAALAGAEAAEAAVEASAEAVAEAVAVSIAVDLAVASAEGEEENKFIVMDPFFLKKKVLKKKIHRLFRFSGLCRVFRFEKKNNIQFF